MASRIRFAIHTSYTALALTFLTLAAAYSESHRPMIVAAAGKTITVEEKRRFDVLFANELATWNQNSVRFTGGIAAFKAREQFFDDLASEGYEIAGLFSRVAKPSQGVFIFDREAFERLRSLADSGDVSAMCFLSEMYGNFRDKDRKRLPYSIQTEVECTIRGSELGHPLCQIKQSFFYRVGTFGHPKDTVKADQMLLEDAPTNDYGGMRNG